MQNQGRERGGCMGILDIPWSRLRGVLYQQLSSYHKALYEEKKDILGGGRVVYFRNNLDCNFLCFAQALQVFIYVYPLPSFQNPMHASMKNQEQPYP